MNQYWIPNHEINKRTITKEIQCYLGPDAYVRSYSLEGEEGFLIVTPGPCLTDEQIDDLCRKSRQTWERQAAQREREKKIEPTEKKLKRPLNRPVVVSKSNKEMKWDDGQSSASYDRRSSGEDRRDDRWR